MTESSIFVAKASLVETQLKRLGEAVSWLGSSSRGLPLIFHAAITRVPARRHGHSCGLHQARCQRRHGAAHPRRDGGVRAHRQFL
jgi:hypothetical protein